MLSHKFRLCPSTTCKQKLNQHMELCKRLYNSLLSEPNLVGKKGTGFRPTDAQALTVDLKKHEKSELREVHSKVLQVVNCQLGSNVRTLARLKRDGRFSSKRSTLICQGAGRSPRAPSLNQEAYTRLRVVVHYEPP